MAKPSPTVRSRDEMKARGYTVEVVEHWNAFARKRKDLFGFIDLLCIKEGEIVGVQSTSYSNISARVKKIAEHENTGVVRKAGIRIVVMGWKRGKNKEWTFKEVECS